MRTRHIVLVLDKNFGKRLLDLYKSKHVWVIESESNNPYIAQIMDSATSLNDCTKDFGITPFCLPQELSFEQVIACGLDNIWDHHGFSDKYCLQQLDIYGVELTEFIHKELLQFGFERFAEIDRGISAYKLCL